MFRSDLNANATELRVNTAAEMLDVTRRYVVGIRVEFRGQSTNGRFDQFASVDWFYIIAFNLIHRIGKQLKEFIVLLVIDGIDSFRVDRLSVDTFCALRYGGNAEKAGYGQQGCQNPSLNPMQLRQSVSPKRV